MSLPGSDFGSYRWGQTVDPITPGLMDRPYVARELVPWGSAASADLLNALDHRIQEGTLDPSALAPVARLMNAGSIVYRADTCDFAPMKKSLNASSRWPSWFLPGRNMT